MLRLSGAGTELGLGVFGIGPGGGGRLGWAAGHWVVRSVVVLRHPKPYNLPKPFSTAGSDFHRAEIYRAFAANSSEWNNLF